jgi:glycosyltransferase involved in cell wall biosynthesis
MKVVFFANVMPDPCGAFFHDLILARALQARGHSVTFVVLGSKFPRKGVYRGVPFVYYEVAGSELERADIWNTPHYPVLGLVRRLNERYEKPLVVVMHYGEDTKLVENCTRHGKWAEFLWFVSTHIQNKIMSTKTIASSFVDTHVVRPTFLEHEIKLYDPPARPEGDCITLINANVLKGLDVFVELAKRFPDRKFLGVRPYYNAVQVPALPNIEWMDLQEDIRVVLRRTRVLVVPSFYESWGRVAFEALYNGIPVLYAKPNTQTQFLTGSTEGMQAWIQDNGIACSRDTLDDWVMGIHRLDDSEVYAEYSDKAYACTRDMNIFTEIPDIERRFIEYSTKFPAAKKTKGDDVPAPSTQRMGPNRFMGGGPILMRRPVPGPRMMQAAAPPPAAPQAAPRPPPGPPRQSVLGFRGGRFGTRR